MYGVLSPEAARFQEIRPVAQCLYAAFAERCGLWPHPTDTQLDAMTRALQRLEDCTFLAVFTDCVYDGSLGRYLSDTRCAGGR